jgi:hypothetical protein
MNAANPGLNCEKGLFLSYITATMRLSQAQKGAFGG